MEGGPLAWQTVARLGDLTPGRGRCVRIGDLEVGLFRVGDRVYALENACPHRGHPLSEGCVEGAVVVCPAHGWDFDVRTGFKPGDADGFPIPCFAVRVEEGEVQVDVENVVNLPPRARRGGAPPG